jgi:hypothetical protein
MKVALATSLHLDHGQMSLDAQAGDRLPMQTFVPMGLLSLKAFADRAGTGAAIAVRELNGLVNDGAIPNDDRFHDHIAGTLLAAGDDLVGLMTDADSLAHTVLIARQIKERSPGTLVAIGGPASSPLAARFLESFPEFDFLIRGEGEETFAEMLSTLRDARSLETVLGLVWRGAGGTVHANPARPVIPDLDQLPIPDFAAYDRMATAPIYLDVGRGCPFNCKFCSTASFFSRRYRVKSVARIIAEITLLRDTYGRREINFSHDIFTCDNAFASAFCDAFAAARLGVSWTCSTRTDVITPELLERMAAAGCVEIYYGIEAGSARMQAAIDKNLDLERSRQIVRATVEAGIRPVTGFIVGYPDETEETLNDTIGRFFEFLQLGNHRAHMFTLCPFHESPMYQSRRTEINQAAEYHDLPLAAGPQARCDELKTRHREIFASGFRYDTPGLAAGLAEASEELSPQMVVLKNLWPLLIPHYPSPLDWYRRWVAWIRAENLRRRPSSRFRHQGDASDLLRFAESEIERLGLAGSCLSDLVAYETLKRTAGLKLRPGRAAPVPNVAAETVVGRGCEFLMGLFRHDLAHALGGKGVQGAAPEAGSYWIVFAKPRDDTVSTIRIGDLGRRLIEAADQPRSALDLIRETVPAGSGGPEPQHYEGAFSVLRQLVAQKILTEVSPS